MICLIIILIYEDGLEIFQLYARGVHILQSVIPVIVGKTLLRWLANSGTEILSMVENVLEKQ